MTCFISENRILFGTSTMLSWRNFLLSQSGLGKHNKALILQNGLITVRKIVINECKENKWHKLELRKFLSCFVALNKLQFVSLGGKTKQLI